ncbi:MAG: hypothetical protein J7L53_07085 [Deltaproteobacteria bacterium]|nr:hypothetical protein [Deltaproteobacteria bacterium]
MKGYLRVIIVCMAFFVLVLSGCSSSDDDYIPSATGSGNQATGENQGDDNGQDEPLEGIEAVLASQGMTLVDQVTYDGDTGYLAEYDGKSSQGHNAKGEFVGPLPKYCLVLTGSPYNMGYQMGYLRPEATQKMATEFLEYILFSELELLGIDMSPDDPGAEALFKLIYKELLVVCTKTEPSIPDYLKREMSGVAQGAIDGGYPTSYGDILIINQGIDALFSTLASILIPATSDESTDFLNDLRDIIDTYPSLKDKILIQDGRVIFPDAKGFFPRFGCNEFVISGNATTGGQTYHGRDFMFATAGVYQDVVSMVVYLPDDGYPFVSVSPPGFVGKVTGLNSEGLSMGQDISLGNAFNSDPGLGCMLLIRDILQHCSNLSEAVERVRATKRGVPWDYIIGDDEENEQWGHGVVLEEGRSFPPFDGPDLLPDWEYWLLSGLPVEINGEEINLGIDYIDKLDDDQLVFDDDEGRLVIDRGVMVRGSKWQFPSEFRDISFGIPVPNPFFPMLDRWNIWIYFPDQVETNPDVVVATNHFIIPRMRFTQFEPIVYLGYAIEPLPESVWRYETMVDLILDNYENIDFFGPDSEQPAEGSAGWIIDFLNPNGEINSSAFYRDKDKPLDGEVEGHHAIMNNTTKEIKALFGYYQDPWVGIKLQPFVDWAYGTEE